VAPQTLEHHGPQVRDARQLRLFNDALGAAGNGVDLKAELSLQVGTFDEVGHGPLQRRSRGQRTRAEELRDEADDLPIADGPGTIFMDS
jgi:hypothetical protein